MALDETEGSGTDIGLWRGHWAIERIEGVEGAGRRRENKVRSRENMAVEGHRTNLIIVIIASRLSLTFSFSQNNDYRDNHIIFREKRLLFGALFSRKTKRNDYHYQP
jgi:hypothetical protein